MKHGPRPAFRIEKQLGGLIVGWDGVSGNLEGGSYCISQLMESQIWHQFTGSMRGRFSKGIMASAHLDARHFSFSLYITGVLSCYPSAGAHRE